MKGEKMLLAIVAVFSVVVCSWMAIHYERKYTNLAMDYNSLIEEVLWEQRETFQDENIWN